MQTDSRSSSKKKIELFKTKQKDDVAATRKLNKPEETGRRIGHSRTHTMTD